jgi:four helix bundle protein
LSRQLFRSAASVAVNYSAAGRARSRREFIAKISIVVEEIDETVFWLELIKDGGIYTGPDLDAITKEARELLYIFSASRKTAKENANNQTFTKSPNL